MPAEPSATNTYVPSFEATGQIVAFVRDPKKFKFNDYVQYRPATKMVGLYMVYDKDNPARVVTSQEFLWADGQVRPEGNNNLDTFDYKEYRTKRYDIPFTVGNLARNQAPWDLVAAQAAGRLQQYATLMTYEILQTLESTGNWGSNTDTATNLGGGKWDAGSAANPYMQRGLYAGIEAVLKATNGMVTPDMLRLVIGPDAARKVRTSAEILDYVKSSPFAMAQIRGELDNPNVLYGLPSHLFGVELVIEDAVRVSSRKGAAATSRGFVKDGDKAILLTKDAGLPGDQVGMMPTPNFSTFQVMYYVGDRAENTQDQGGGPSGLYTVQTFEDTRNERLDGHVVTNFAKVLAAPEAGYLFQDILT